MALLEGTSVKTNNMPPLFEVFLPTSVSLFSAILVLFFTGSHANALLALVVSFKCFYATSHSSSIFFLVICYITISPSNAYFYDGTYL
jgi:hypothetical protein